MNNIKNMPQQQYEDFLVGTRGKKVRITRPMTVHRSVPV